MSEHTTGPWVAHGEPNGGADDWLVSSADGKHKAIAACSKRDAQLIAAAPELLTALVGAVGLIELLSPLEGDIMRNARRAIEKATGTVSP